MPDKTQWQRLPRSLRYECDGLALDVWDRGQVAVFGRGPDPRRWRWTVMQTCDGVYTHAGQELSQEAACKAALEAAS